MGVGMCVWFGLLEVPGEGAGVCARVVVILFSVVCCSVLWRMDYFV